MRSMIVLTATWIVGALGGTVHAGMITVIDAQTRNGSFENPVGASGSASTADFWSSGFNSTSFQRRSDSQVTPPDGDWTLVLGSILGAYQNTDYQIQATDVFSLSFAWAGAFQWETAARINWRLFTTSDDTVAGAITEIASGYVTGKPSATLATLDWSDVDVLVDGGTVGPANVGRELFLEFYTSNLSGDVDRFARLDNVLLTVVPEPGTLVLSALGFGLIMFQRRRRG